MSDNDIYQQELLEHYRNPQNFGRLKKATYRVYQVNPLCGDEMDLGIQLDNKDKVVTVRFSGQGCAISIASASYLTEHFKDKTLVSLRRLTPSRVLRLIGVPVSPARMKCALLGHAALQEILKLHDQISRSGKNIRNPRSRSRDLHR